MNNTVPSSKEQVDFSVVYGTLFSLATSIEYLACCQGLFGERKANYAKNKSKEAEDACKTVYDTLYREITKRLSPEEKSISDKAIEDHKSLIYDLFLLNPDHQVRVKKLIDKLKKEEK